MEVRFESAMSGEELCRKEVRSIQLPVADHTLNVRDEPPHVDSSLAGEVSLIPCLKCNSSYVTFSTREWKAATADFILVTES